jgi:prepilin peptidase CpaA
MTHPFFPTVEFAWAFFATLVGILLACSVIDLKKMIVPKWLTLPTLGLGLGFNAVRGSWLGLESSAVWQLQPGGLFLGALDGALFAIAGFAVAFGIFFVFWILGICGGGDVKLCAAVGAWIGPDLILRLLLVTVFMVAVFMATQIVLALIFGNRPQESAGHRPGAGVAERPARRLLIFSPPLAMATALLLLWTFRGELQLLPVGPPNPPSVYSAGLIVSSND